MSTSPVTEFLEQEKAPKFLKIELPREEIILPYDMGLQLLGLLEKTEIYLHKWHSSNKKGEPIIISEGLNATISIMGQKEYLQCKSANLLLPDK